MTATARYQQNHNVVAAAAERTGQGGDFETRRAAAGTAALLRLAAKGVKDPVELRAASAAARAAVTA